MRVRQAPAAPLSPKIRFACTDHPITVWAGAILLRLYFELIGLRTGLVPLLPPLAKTANNQIPPPWTCCWPGGMGWPWGPNGLNI